MPLDTSLTQEMAPLDVGDPNKVTQEVPPGKWAGTITCSNRVSSKGAPQLMVTAMCEECLTEGNEDYVGARVTSYITFKPATDMYAHLPKLEVKRICDAYELELPDYAPLADENLPTGERFQGFSDFIEALEGTQREFWTSTDKRDGSPRLNWSEPGKRLERVIEEEETPAPTAAAKGKTNGHANGKAAAGKGKAAKPAARAQARR
jgi:hypothetical protein